MIQAARCPKCEKLLLCELSDVFVQCPHCEKNISVEESVELLQQICSNPALTSEILARCLEIERRHGPQLPLLVLSVVEEAFPLNEEVAFIILKISGFQSVLVRSYLSRFKNSKKKHPFAEDFLQEALTVRNMEFSPLFEEYIRAKLPPKRQQRYFELMRELRETYSKTSEGGRALTLLYIFYISAATLNLAMVVTFILVSWPLYVYAIIALFVLSVQISLLFLHNRAFGNRLKIADLEHLLMVIYMSSIAVAIGGTFLGRIINF